MQTAQGSLSFGKGAVQGTASRQQVMKPNEAKSLTEAGD